MLAKIAAVAQSKVALAVLGVVLVGGGGSAVAVAATTGHLSTLGVNLNSEKSANASSTKTPDSHAHTTGVEGLLVSCSTTTPPATIVVKDSKNALWTFNVSATTKFNGDTQTASESAGGSSATGAGASSAKGDNSANGGSSTVGAGASSAKGDNSASTHAAPTLADVCKLAGSRDVQVQATPNGSAYDAWKVTVEGPGSTNGDSSTGGSSTDGASTKGDSSKAGDSSQGGASTMGGASTKGTDGGTSSAGDH